MEKVELVARVAAAVRAGMQESRTRRTRPHPVVRQAAKAEMADLAGAVVAVRERTRRHFFLGWNMGEGWAGR